jgi:hypothetical protein
MYPFMTLNDNTEIVHSEVFDANGEEQVKVYIEKQTDCGFASAYCYLPEYKWEKIDGFTESEINKFQDFIASVAHVIFDLARKGGFANAANL